MRYAAGKRLLGIILQNRSTGLLPDLEAGGTGGAFTVNAPVHNTAKEVHSMDEQKHRFTRLYGNIGCIVGLVLVNC